MTQLVADIEAFISAPIRLAAIIRTWRRRQSESDLNKKTSNITNTTYKSTSSASINSTSDHNNKTNYISMQKNKKIKREDKSTYKIKSIIGKGIKSVRGANEINCENKKKMESPRPKQQLLKFESKHRIRDYDASNHLTVSSILNHNSSKATKQSTAAICSLGAILTAATLLLLVAISLFSNANPLVQGSTVESISKHSPYYLDFLPPSSHFSYAEGRQSRSVDSANSEIQGSDIDESVARQATADLWSEHSTIHKRSSALLPGPPMAQYLPLVSSMHMLPAAPLLSRRIMMQQQQQQQQFDLDQHQSSFESRASSNTQQQQQQQQQKQQARQHLMPVKVNRGISAAHSESDRALLRQKQHIQYHDQWPSMAGKCHKRTLNFCASVLPFNTTTFPNIIGDTNRFEVKRSLPFFGFLAKSSCNKRLDELLCLLLEPPCHPQTGIAIPPCKKFCRLALEGCNEYIPATLALSSVFDCRQYPDSNEPSQCVNLAQGNKCSQDEFKCPDETCIPRNWLCDGVRDCVFAADEANCTETSGSLTGSSTGQESTGNLNPGISLGSRHSSAPNSICSTEEFKCDAKCVPKAWRCDGERDCLDGTDEEDCEKRPRCGADRFRCADGNGCIPKRWVCDGKAECRDGSDEMNCSQRECSQNDFKCDNGICIPSLWRCDRQNDCKDGSDERACSYPEPRTTTTTTTTTSSSAPMMTTVNANNQDRYQNATSQNSILNSIGDHKSDPNEQVLPETTTGNPQEQGQQNQEQQQQRGTAYPAESQIAQSATLDSSIQVSEAQTSDSNTGNSNPATIGVEQQQQQQQQLDLINDVARIIQQEIGEQANKEKQAAADSKSSSGNSEQSLIKQQDRTSATKLDATYDVIGLESKQQQSQIVAQQSNEQPEHQTGVQLDSDKGFALKQAVTSSPLVQTTNQVEEQQQQQFQQRVPIYRNLFKSFKGGPGHLVRRFPAQNGQSSQNQLTAMQNHQQLHQPQQSMQMLLSRQNQLGSMAVPGSRRRRERYELAQQQQQSIESIAPGEQSKQLLARPAPVGFEQQASSQNSTRPSGHNSGSVSSYLQLLNSRYQHLRGHNRVHY